MLSELFSYLLGKTADRVPSFILSRLLPPKKVAKDIVVDLRRDNPISLNLSDAPQIDLWFEIINQSDLKLTLDRLLINVWFSQPVLEGSILTRYDVPARKSVKDIRYWQSLTDAQKRTIESCQSTQGRIYISLRAYFQSKVGMIEVENRIERGKV